MNTTLTIAQRVLLQLKHDKKFFILMLLAPFIVIYFLKVFMNAMPAHFPVERYSLPIVAFVIYFFSFLLCSLVLVQERTKGTLERLFINGASKHEIIMGYLLGYSGLAFLVAGSILVSTLLLFNFSYTTETILQLLAFLLLMSVVSTLFGIFISTFARTEMHLFPFIPLVTLPAMFFSGLLVDVNLLPTWAQYLAYTLPLYYANINIDKIVTANFDHIFWGNIIVLNMFILGLLWLSAMTFKEVE